MEVKVCPMCKKEKDIKEFGLRKNGNRNKNCLKCLQEVAEMRERIKEEYSKNIDFENDTKICSKCGEEKKYQEFRKDKRKRDGHFHVCKQCVSKKVNVKNESVVNSIEGEMTCITCNVKKSLKEFYFDKGKNSYKKECKECHAVRSRKNRIKKIREGVL